MGLPRESKIYIRGSRYDIDFYELEDKDEYLTSVNLDDGHDIDWWMVVERKSPGDRLERELTYLIPSHGPIIGEVRN